MIKKDGLNLRRSLLFNWFNLFVSHFTKKIVTNLSENTQKNRLISYGEVSAVTFDNYTKHVVCLKHGVFNLKIFIMWTFW